MTGLNGARPEREQSYWTRRTGRWSRRSLLKGLGVAGLGGGALAAVGCGDDDDTVSPTATSAGTTPSVSASASPTIPAGGTPKDGGVYTAHVNIAGNTLDIHRELYPSIVQTAGLAYDMLIAWDDVIKGTIRGEIARAQPEQPDSVTFVFTIRDGIKWQNKAPANGRPLTMDDIKWNIERQRAQKLANGQDAKNFYRYGSVYSFADSIQYTDATHLTVKLKQPNATWLSAMCQEFNVIEYKDVAEQIESDFGTFDPRYIVGTGPYIFDEYSPAKGAHAVRNQDYFLKKAGEQVQFFDGIRWFNLSADVNSRRTAFEGKQLDIVSVPKDSADGIVSAHRDVKVLDVPVPDNNLELAYDYTGNAALANQRIRQAIFLAIDRNLCAQQWYQGLARPNALVPWGFTEWALPQTELANAPGYRANKDDDIKEARALWSAGGGDSIDPKLLQFAIHDQMDQTIKEWWPAMVNKNLGTDKFSLTSIPVATLLQYLTQRQGPGHLGAWTQWTSPDPRRQVADRYIKGGTINWWGYSTPEMEDVVGKSLVEFDHAKAVDLIKQAQRLALKDGGASHFQITGGVTRYLHWPYLHREGPTFITYERQLGRRSWIDQSDPSFQGRPKSS